MRALVCLALCVGCAGGPSGSDDGEDTSVTPKAWTQGRSEWTLDDGRQVQVYVPACAEVEADLPLVIALHPAGLSARSMLDLWQNDAADGCWVVMAPAALQSSGWSVSDDGPHVGAVRRRALQDLPIAPGLQVISGWAGGGSLALAIGAEEKSPYAVVAPFGADTAVATREGRWPPRNGAGRSLVWGHNRSDPVVPYSVAEQAVQDAQNEGWRTDLFESTSTTYDVGLHPRVGLAIDRLRE